MTKSSKKNINAELFTSINTKNTKTAVSKNEPLAKTSEQQTNEIKQDDLKENTNSKTNKGKGKLITDKTSEQDVKTEPLKVNKESKQDNKNEPLNATEQNDINEPLKENESENNEIFDATIDTNLSNKEFEREMENIRKKAIIEKQLLANTKNAQDNSRKTFVSSVIACLVSVGVLLALTLIFFFWAKWYGAGIGMAIVTIIVSQVWVSFFKKSNLKYNEANGLLDNLENDNSAKDSTAPAVDKKSKNNETKDSDNEISNDNN